MILIRDVLVKECCENVISWVQEIREEERKILTMDSSLEWFSLMVRKKYTSSWIGK